MKKQAKLLYVFFLPHVGSSFYLANSRSTNRTEKKYNMHCITVK